MWSCQWICLDWQNFHASRRIPSSTACWCNWGSRTATRSTSWYNWSWYAPWHQPSRFDRRKPRKWERRTNVSKIRRTHKRWKQIQVFFFWWKGDFFNSSSKCWPFFCLDGTRIEWNLQVIAETPFEFCWPMTQCDFACALLEYSMLLLGSS